MSEYRKKYIEIEIKTKKDETENKYSKYTAVTRRIY